MVPHVCLGELDLSARADDDEDAAPQAVRLPTAMDMLFSGEGSLKTSFTPLAVALGVSWLR